MESILQSDALQALGWTLVHSVWQIAGLAFLLMLTLALLRGYSPRVRYCAALTAMAAVIVLSVLTFLLYYRAFASQETIQAAAPAAFGVDGLVAGSFAGLKAFLYRYLFLFLLVWLCGVTILSFRFAGSMFLLRRLRLSALPVSEQWTGRLNRMAERMSIDRAVRLAESALVAAPVMIGHLKPLILLPAGMLAAIPADQVEAILAHELAHIRRSDFLINLLQSVAEIVYFFHPGIWWISSVVRREREQCCDDLATRGGCHPVTLAFALSEVGEWTQAEGNGNFALAFAGKKEQPLLERVKRLLGQEPPRSSGFLPAGTVTLAVIAFLLLSGSGRVFSSSSGEQNRPAETHKAEADLAGLDTLPSPNGSTSVEVHNGHERPAGGKDDPGTGNGAGESALAYGSDAAVKQIDTAGPPPPPKPPVFSKDMSVPPPPPVPDSLPPAPASPPPVPDSTSWSQFQQQMEGLGAAITEWTKNINVNDKGVQIPGMQFNFDREQMKEFERSMEAFGKEMEKWGEAYGKQIAAWAKANEPKMKEFQQKMKRWEKENEPRMKEYEREMEAYRKEMEAYGKEMEQYGQEVEERARRQAEQRQQEVERGREELERRQRDKEFRSNPNQYSPPENRL